MGESGVVFVGVLVVVHVGVACFTVWALEPLLGHRGELGGLPGCLFYDGTLLSRVSGLFRCCFVSPAREGRLV